MQDSGDVTSYLSNPTPVGHIHLNIWLTITFFMKFIIDMRFILLLDTWINVFLYICYFMWRFNTFTSH
jgi:hypothetical protein